MAANKNFQSNANHRNTESRPDSFCGTAYTVPSDSNAGSLASYHSAENHRNGPREIIADALAPPLCNQECSSNLQECGPPTPEDKCSTETWDKIATAAIDCSKTTTPQLTSSDYGRYRPPPVIDITTYKAFPPAARHRALLQEAMKFAANARNIFVHYAEPVLDLRRKEKLAAGTTKKKFYYNAARLWAGMQTIDEMHEQRFFWNQKSVELKLALKKKTITNEDLLRDAGFEEDWWECRKYAEMAVGWYLGQEVPEEFRDDADVCPADATKCENRGPDEEIGTLALEVKAQDLPKDISKLSFRTAALNFAKPPLNDDHPLLNVLPEPFTYDSKMIYGQFAHADYIEIRQLDGKQQAARLRQLADLFDSTGKVLFYYYAYPHIWKDFRPLKIDETVATRAQDKWKLLGPKEQEVWRTKSAEVKKLLGNGDVEGLICLKLDCLDLEVLRLHRVMGDVLR